VIAGFSWDFGAVVSNTGESWGITAENMEKLQHTDFNEDTTNVSGNAASSSVRL